MKIINLLHVFLTGMLFSLSVWSAIEVYDFNNEVEKQRFQHLIAELRCPKCQNQNLADSDAEIAKDLKARVYRLINEGKSDTEIVDYLVDRYGDFVTYRPPLKPATLLLWFGPFLLLALVGAILILRTYNINRKHLPQVKPDQEKLNEVLAKYSEKPDAD